MIKVIASDMDGTLLNDAHELEPQTVEAIRRAQERGIRFMIATGRNFSQTMEQLDGLDLGCDYILASGAEVRDEKQQVVSRIAMDPELCAEVFEELCKWPVSVIFSTDSYSYRIGTPEEVEQSLILQAQNFHLDISEAALRESPLFLRMKENTRASRDVEELKKAGVPIYKIFLFSEDVAMLRRLGEVLSGDGRIAVAASFETNLEITDVRAQKGPVLKAYIESLGYTMDEVMVLGDSTNDFSMLSMDFGATVAMGNAMPEVKEAAKYVTRTNQEGGVAYTIDCLLKKV
ncbi:Cof-type HAD-IIB family hydrolase [Lachnospiraceae bacterium 47-T17]